MPGPFMADDSSSCIRLGASKKCFGNVWVGKPMNERDVESRCWASYGVSPVILQDAVVKLRRVQASRVWGLLFEGAIFKRSLKQAPSLKTIIDCCTTVKF